MNECKSLLGPLPKYLSRTAYTSSCSTASPLQRCWKGKEFGKWQNPCTSPGLHASVKRFVFTLRTPTVGLMENSSESGRGMAQLGHTASCPIFSWSQQGAALSPQGGRGSIPPLSSSASASAFCLIRS